MVRLQTAPRNLLHRRVNIHNTYTKIVAREPMIYTVRKIRHSRLDPSRFTTTVTHAHARAHARKTCAHVSARIKQWTTPGVTTISINYPAVRDRSERSPSRLSSNIDYMPISCPVTWRVLSLFFDESASPSIRRMHEATSVRVKTDRISSSREDHHCSWDERS